MKKIVLVVSIIFNFAMVTRGQVVQPFWAWQNTFNADIRDIVYHNDVIYTCATFTTAPFIFGNANFANLGASDALVMKWDTSGNLIWAKQIAGSNDEIATAITVNSAGEIVVAGHTNSGSINVEGNLLTTNGGSDVFVARYDTGGNYISAHVIGSAGNEMCFDICTDQQNNFYIAGTGGLSKYTPAAIFVWQQGLSVTKVFYSAIDNTIIATGAFTGTISAGNYSIAAAYSQNWGVQPDIFALKITTANTPLFLLNVSNNVRGEYDVQVCLNEQSAKLFVCYSWTGVSLTEYMDIRQISSAGVLSNPIITLSDFESGPRCRSISTYDSLLSFNVQQLGYTNHIYNLNTFQPVKSYDVSGVAQNAYFQCVRRVDAIYTNRSGSNSFGKISGALLTGSPSFQSLHKCIGSNATISGNIVGGVGALTYNWLPVTGLNNTNTNTVSFTATNNITYTLTVTDAIGQIAKDTFEIIIDTPIAPANLTAQYPFLCDTMLLYANNGIPGSWYYVVGNYLYPPPGQFGGNGLIQTIIQPGRYMYRAHNTCGWRYDSIDVAAVLTTVTANVTDDTICEGQSVIFNGSGAISYTWTNGVTDNVPFTPVYTPYLLNYIVTGSDANGCLGKDTIGVRVYQNVNVTTNLSICANQTPYTWNGQNLDSTGTYTANFTSMYGCDSIATLNLTVSPCIVCVPDFTINYSPFYNSLTESQTWIKTSGTVLILAGDKVKLDANTNSYVQINPGFKAEYGSTFVAQAYNGCTAGSPQLPNAKIFNGENKPATEIVLYPNPTTGLIHIQHDEKLSGIQIFDMVGQLIINQKCNGETETNIDLSNLPNGVYHVKAAGYQSVKVLKND